ncbi:MAG TPA: T9SS type A sorting domain-containing protein [Bacteroidia bacterium]|nr:T9SS type A sorting domain-containing protein [Bacteroidia bacterium]
MNTKKITVFAILIILNSTAFGQMTPRTGGGLKSKVDNYTTFTVDNKNISPQLRKLTPLKYQNNPDFGILPYDVPNTSYLELIQKRTLYSRYYVKITSGHTDTTIAIQKSLNPINYYDTASHFFRAIDPRLKPFSYSQKIFTAPHQVCPTKIDIGNGFISITNGSNEMQFARKLQLLHKDTLGIITNLGSANWSNYSVGDDGAMIYNIFPNIDLKITAGTGSFETNFIINSNLSLNNGWLIVRDSMNIPADLTTGMGNGAMNSSNHWVGDIYFSQGDSTRFAILQGHLHDISSNDTTIAYEINNNVFDIYTPVAFLNDTSTHYPVTIDPTTTGTILLTNVSGSDYDDNGYLGCSNSLSVLTPANCTITDLQFLAPYQGNNGYWSHHNKIYAGIFIGLGTCQSPTVSSGAIWACASWPYDYGTCGTGYLSFYSDVSSCVPAPACTPYNLNFTLYFWNDWNYNPCSNYYIEAASNWSIEVIGNTVTQPAPPTSSTGSTVCYGHTTNLKATGSYGVPGYTYSWSPATGLSSTTTNPTTATVSATTTYTITIKDACGQTATQKIKITEGGCLPIQLLKFTAKYNATTNITNLNWATASETNNNYFTVERTLDGINYTTVDTVNGADNSTQKLTYSAIDKNPVKGVDYYRLKQTDFDGNFTYSKVVSVTVDASGKAKLSLIPNPVSNEAVVNFVSPIIGTAMLKIYDYTGRLIKTQQIATNVGNNTVPLDISNFNNGVYFITVNNSLQKYSAKLVVNH